jgi:peptide deformylase
MDAEGFTARAFCHEIDHLSGHLFTEIVKKYVDINNTDED